MSKPDRKPVLYGALFGALLGLLIGLLISRRRAEGGRTSIDAKAATSIGFAALALAKHVIDAFGA